MHAVFEMPLPQPESGMVTTDPACGCRDPFSEPATDRDEITLDVRGLSRHAATGRALEIAERLEPNQRLRLIDEAVDWALLAQLGRYGCRYRIVASPAARAETLIASISVPDSAD